MEGYSSAAPANRTPQLPPHKSQLKAFFLKSYYLYERLFDCIANDQAYYKRPEPLRHPLIFYFGHTAVVYVNKCIEAGLLQKRINPRLETVFAVGVDEMGWDDLTPAHYDWPTVQETRDYRALAKETILRVLEEYDGEFKWEDKGWALLMGVQHEMIHFDTSAVIVRRLGIEDVRPTQWFPVCPIRNLVVDSIPKNELLEVPAFKARFKRTTDSLKTYAWDNEIGEESYDLEGFQASKYLVSNGQFFEFVNENGYKTQKYWTAEGWAWSQCKKVELPLFWVIKQGEYFLRTLCEEIKMPWDWPVVVNNLEASAFCNWKSAKSNQQLRLPTEGEYEAMASTLIPNAKVHLRMESCASEMPVNSFEHSSVGLCDVVGHLWQHLWTLFYPFEGFKIHPYYEDYSTPAFDGKHDMLRGGSWINQGAFGERTTRNYFRRHFYQFSGFRYVLSDNPAPQHFLGSVWDEDLATAVRLHYLQKNSYLASFSTWIIEEIEKTGATGWNRCLTVGCSSGRLTFQLTNKYKKSIGLDSTSRFFRAATILQETGIYKIESANKTNCLTIKLQDIHVPNYKDAQFYQQKPNNIDIKKFSGFDLIVLDNYAIGQNILLTALHNIHQYLQPAGFIAINSAVPRGLTGQPSNQQLQQQLNHHFQLVSHREAVVGVMVGENPQHLGSEFSLWRLKTAKE